MIYTFYYKITHEGEEYEVMYQEEFTKTEDAFNRAFEIAYSSGKPCLMRALNTEFIARP